MRKSKFHSLCMLGLIVLFVATFAGAAYSAEKNYEIVLATTTGKTEIQTMTAFYFKEKLEEYSKGRITVKIHPAGSLCSQAGCVKQLKLGAIDMFHISFANYAAFSKNFDLLNMPYVFPDMEAVKKVLTGPMGEKLKERSLENDKLRVVYYMDVFGFRDLFNNARVLRTPNDTKGLKLRVTVDEVQPKMAENWGFTPINLPWQELYSGLQTKVVNGFYVPVAHTEIVKFDEVAPFCTRVGGQLNSQVSFIKPEKYDELPQELKAAFDRAAKEAEEYCWITSEEMDKLAVGKIEARGTKVYVPTKEEMDLWKETSGYKGMWEKLLNDENKALLKDVQSMLGK